VLAPFFEKGLKAKGSGCIQHRGWPGHAARRTIAPAGKASSAAMLSCCFPPFSLPSLLFLQSLLQPQPPTLPAAARLMQSRFCHPLQHPLRAGTSPDLSAAAFAQQREPLEREGHLHAAEGVPPVLLSPQEQHRPSKPRDPSGLESPWVRSKDAASRLCRSEEGDADGG